MTRTLQLPLVLLAVVSAAAAADRGTAPTRWPASSMTIDVRERGAKGDGITDDTEAIKQAFDEAMKQHFHLIYFPAGTYLVSDTVGWRNFEWMQGDGQGKTVIRLKDACPGFTDAGQPKAVLRCLYNNNESIGNYLAHVTVDTGKGNPGAIGLRYNCHNWGTCEDVTITSGDGAGAIGLDLSETEFGPALVRRVTVEGFDTGIRTPGQPSSATLEHITIRNQRKVGIENHFPLQLRGLTSVNRVPAVHNQGGCLTQLVLLDADLSGGAGDQAAVINDGQGYYLRNVSSKGYKATLLDGSVEITGTIAERIAGEQKSLFPSKMSSLNLPVEEPPTIPVEPPATWKIVDDSAEDDTTAIQQAFDGEATTVCFKAKGNYRISDTVVVRGKVKRIVAMMETGIGCDIASFGVDKPMVRIAGTGTEPVIWERVGVGAWPHYVFAIEIATKRPVYLTGFMSVAGCVIKNSKEATGGKLFIDEFFNHLRLDFPMSTWIRQCNTENNPFDPKQSKIPTYITNHGGDLWIFGLKTESPAINVVTTGGGRTEVLGGFFRDHIGPEEYDQQVPAFRTEDSSLTAIYTQYVHAPGKARDLHLIEVRDQETKELRLGTGNYIMSLYSSQPVGK